AHDSVTSLFQKLIDCWNARDAAAFASLFAPNGSVVGFDGSQVDGRPAIETHLRQVFGSHETARYVTIVREVRTLGRDAILVRAVAGMVPRGRETINPAVNAIQSLIAPCRPPPERESHRGRVCALRARSSRN